MWLYWQARTNLLTAPLRMLHVAPERCLAQQLRHLENLDYVTADIAADGDLAEVQMDITRIEAPAESFDVIYASHVLEHVDDDQLAMRELYRVLKTGGWAILLVPMWGPRTKEDPTVTDPIERQRRFGQSDHVRMYGHDGKYEYRLREAGFDVQVVPFVRELSPDVVRRHRLRVDEDIYLCCKA